MISKANILFPQWQGGGEISTLYGTEELRDRYLQGTDILEIPVSRDLELPKKNDIIGYDILISQMKKAADAIAKTGAKKLFTVGGSCDADVPSVAYLNQLYKGDLTVLWFDAHGDLNTPEESWSKLFYGMPVRALLGDGDREIENLVPLPLKPTQVINLGGRDFDPPEQAYVDKNSVRVVPTAELKKGPEAALKAIRDAGHTHIHIHIDLDITEPKEFSSVPLPVPNGPDENCLRAVWTAIPKEFSVVGVSLYECNPLSGDNDYLRFITDLGKSI